MHANKIVCDKTYKKIDKSQIDIVEIEESEQNFNPEDTDLFMEVPTLEGNHSNTATKRRRTNCKKSQSLALLKHGHSTDSKLTLKDRFRPIRPKPLRLSVAKHKFELPTMNVATLSSNHVIVHTLPKNRIGSNSSNSVNNINNSKNSNTMNIQPVTKEKKIETVKTRDSNTTANSCNINNSNSNISSNNSENISYSNCNKDLRNIKAISKSKNSIELFFESMAQTVLNLPKEVQADIKMQICKIVTNAEIRYCKS